MRGSTTASRMPMAITPPENPTGPPISGSERTASRVACHSGTAVSTRGRTRASTIASTGSPAFSALRRSARACSAAAERGRSPLPGSSMATEAKPYLAAWRARPASRGYSWRSPPGCPTSISGAGVEVGVHRMPGIAPRLNPRSTTPSSRCFSEVKCMVVPFGTERPCRYVLSRPGGLEPSRDGLEQGDQLVELERLEPVVRSFCEGVGQ